MIGGDGINDESNKTAPAPSRYTKLLDAAVKKISGAEEKSSIDSLFDFGEPLDSVANLGFDDYSLVSFVVMR